MHHDRGDLVRDGEVVCTVTSPFETDRHRRGPLGLLVGVLEYPIVYPGNPLCHLVSADETRASPIEVEADAERRTAADRDARPGTDPDSGPDHETRVLAGAATLPGRLTVSKVTAVLCVSGQDPPDGGYSCSVSWSSLRR
jgi:hypothetical protein